MNSSLSQGVVYVLYCTVVSFCLCYYSEQLSLLLDAHELAVN